MIQTVVGGWGSLQGPLFQRWKLAALALALSPCLVTLMIRDPADSGLFPPCPFLALTGLYCPGCGTLRGLHQLFNGHLVAALGLNPFMVLAIPFLGYAFASEVALALAGRRPPKIVVPAALIWLLLGAIILFWALRNIPAYPLSLLAP